MSEESASSWPIPPEGSPCWIEIPAADLAGCKKFYSSLFPTWNFMDLPEGYDAKQIALYSFSAPKGLSGGIIKCDASCKAQKQSNGMGMVVSYFVKSIEETEKRVKELGGEVVVEKTPEHDNGWYAKYKDTEGNIFGIYEMKLKPGQK